MRTFFAALEEGRLIELPDNNKDKSLQILGSLIEAVPGLKAGTQVVESLLTQTMIVYIIRTRKIPFVQSWPSFGMLFTTLVVMAIGAWLPYSPFANFFGMEALPAVFWLWMAGFLITYAVLTHFVKVWFYNRFGID